MPERLTATIWSQPSTETLRKLRLGRLMPALLTRMSMRPCRLSTAAAIFATSALSATSTASASPLPAALSCFSAAASVSLLRPEMTTWAPARASSIAPARPMPEPPPVIQASLPASILSAAEEHFGLLLAEAGGLPAPLSEHFDASLHRRPRGNALAPALHVGILVDVHALAILVDHRRDLVVRRDGEKLGLELVAGADVDGVDAVREPGLLEHDVDLVAVRGRPGIEVDHGLPLFIVGNDYGACNLIVPALLAPVERDPQESQA